GTNKKIIQVAAVMIAITIVLQGSAVTNPKLPYQSKALAISIRLCFFMNAAACFAAAENILAVASAGYNRPNAGGAHRVTFAFVFGGALVFLLNTSFWLWMNVLWAKIITVCTLIWIFGWTLHGIVKG
ncbi:hypothetical protein M408DRAFT_331527, partial [Serendipita vermifera MAFF 305830]